MDLTLTDEQQMLADTARAFVERSCPPDTARTLDARGVDTGALEARLWSEMADAGWPGIVAAPEYGGAGHGILDLALVCEQLGRGPVSSPLVTTTLAALLISWLGSDEQQRQWLPDLARGAAVGTMALLEPGMHDEWDQVAMIPGARLSGTKILVPWAATATVMVVVTAGGLHLLEPSHRGVKVQPHDVLGGEPLFAVTLDAAAAAPLGRPEAAASATARVMDHAAVVGLAFTVGAAERALELSVQHAKDRHQFGHPIGSFQAVAHRCADMRSEIDACRYLAYQAAWALDGGGPSDLVVAAAKTYANDAMRRVFRHAHQVHGALGFSTEHDLHLFTRRAKAFELTAGGTARHRERLAQAMGLGPGS